MLVADYIIQYLADQDIDKIFQVYGSASASLIDAFVRVKDTEYVCVFDERQGGFAAEGYAKASGKFGVLITTSGPGLHNAITPIANCFYDSVPCLFISGQVNSRFMRPTEEIRQIGFQESDVVSIVKPITKYAVTLKKAEDIKYELQKCLYLMRKDRKGPVLLDIPLDIQKQDINPDKLIGYDLQYQVTPTYYTEEVSGWLIEDLYKAKRPVFLVGAGISSATSLLFDLNKELKIPVFPTWNAVDLIASDYEYYGGRVGTYGGAGRNLGIQNCDLLICIGTRLSGRITGGNLSSFARAAKKYMIDIDPANIQPHLQQIKFDVNLQCSARNFLYTFAKYACGKYISFEGWSKQVIQWRDKYDPVKEALAREPNFEVHPYLFMQKLSEHMGPNDIICGDCGGNIVVMGHAFKTKQGQIWISNNGNSPMGGSLGYAIGAKIACPDKQVVCIIGDGGMSTSVAELQTLKNYGINVKVFILDNRIYGITKGFQKVNFEGRFLACGPDGYKPPNYQDVCHAYKIATIDTFYNNNIDEDISNVLNFPGPCIGIIHCDDFHSYFPKMSYWDLGIEDLEPLLKIEELESEMKIPLLEASYTRRGLKRE